MSHVAATSQPMQNQRTHPALVVVALAPRTLLEVVMERRFG
jgi:hypothetical protein